MTIREDTRLTRAKKLLLVAATALLLSFALSIAATVFVGVAPFQGIAASRFIISSPTAVLPAAYTEQPISADGTKDSLQPATALDLRTTKLLRLRQRARRAELDAAANAGPTRSSSNSSSTPIQGVVSSIHIAVAAASAPAADASPSSSSPPGGLGVGLLCVLISVSRAFGVDHASPLSRLIAGTCDRVVIYDADDEPTRTFPWADVVVRGPVRFIKQRVEEAARQPRLDKHRDDADRIRWRTKGALDYTFALEYAHAQRDSFPFVMVLEDDVWLEKNWRERLRGILTWQLQDGESLPAPPPPLPADDLGELLGSDAGLPSDTRWQSLYSSPSSMEDTSIPAQFLGRSGGRDWVAWALFHCEAFDVRAGYQHGEWFEYKACSQALLYRSRLLRPLLSYFKANVGEDPVDFLIRNFFYDTGARMLVAVPSLAQHTGTTGSSFAGKTNKPKRGEVCWSEDYTEDFPLSEEWLRPQTSQEAASDQRRRTAAVVYLPSNGGVTPQPQPRDRRK